MRLLALALLVGCYDPGVEDCQFRCGQQMDCPDGTHCMGKFCRTNGATKSCAAMIDAMPDPCLEIAPPSSCTGAMKFPLDGGGCGVVCTRVVESVDLATACDGVWKPGRLVSIAELDAAPITDRTWLGASRTSTTAPFVWTGYGTNITEPVWDVGFPNTDEDCGYLDMTKRRMRNDRPCDGDNPYICTTP